MIAHPRLWNATIWALEEPIVCAVWSKNTQNVLIKIYKLCWLCIMLSLYDFNPKQFYLQNYRIFPNKQLLNGKFSLLIFPKLLLYPSDSNYTPVLSIHNFGPKCSITYGVFQLLPLSFIPLSLMLSVVDYCLMS